MSLSLSLSLSFLLPLFFCFSQFFGRGIYVRFLSSPKSSHYAFHFPIESSIPFHFLLGKSCPLESPFLLCIALNSNIQPHQPTPPPPPSNIAFSQHLPSYPKRVVAVAVVVGGGGESVINQVEVEGCMVSGCLSFRDDGWWVGAHMMKCPLQVSKNTESPR